MKKLALIMAGILTIGTFGCTAFAGAEESVAESTESVAEPVEVNWSDIEPAVKELGIEGDFVTFDEIALKMWMPTVLAPTELTDEDKENGYIGYFQTEDESAAVAVVYVDVNGATLEEYQTLLAEDETVSELETCSLNGLNALSYKIEDTDSASVAFDTEKGYILEVTFAPISDEGFEQVASIITASIQPEETADAEAADSEAADSEAADSEAA